MEQCNRWADDESNFLADEVRQRSAKKAQEIPLKPVGSMLDDVEKDGDVRRLIHNMMELDEGTTIMNIVVECQKDMTGTWHVSQLLRLKELVVEVNVVLASLRKLPCGQQQLDEQLVQFLSRVEIIDVARLFRRV